MDQRLLCNIRILFQYPGYFPEKALFYAFSHKYMSVAEYIPDKVNPSHLYRVNLPISFDLKPQLVAEIQSDKIE